MTTLRLLCLLSAFTTGLIAGLLFAFVVAVDPGLRSLPDRDYLAAMQQINRAIQNPVFVVVFAGAALLPPLSALLLYRHGSKDLVPFFAASAAFYLAGVIGVTVAGNIPLNDVLAQIDLAGSTPAAITRQRKIFEAPWIRWHSVRTVCSLISFGCAIAGVSRGRTRV